MGAIFRPISTHTISSKVMTKTAIPTRSWKHSQIQSPVQHLQDIWLKIKLTKVTLRLSPTYLQFLCLQIAFLTTGGQWTNYVWFYYSLCCSNWPLTTILLKVVIHSTLAISVIDRVLYSPFWASCNDSISLGTVILVATGHYCVIANCSAYRNFCNSGNWFSYGHSCNCVTWPLSSLGTTPVGPLQKGGNWPSYGHFRITRLHIYLSHQSSAEQPQGCTQAFSVNEVKIIWG